MYPVTYEADYVRDRNRLTTIFRLILVIPWLIVAYLYAIAMYVLVILAWFALLFTGRYPQSFYEFNAGALRYLVRVYGYGYLQTDAWPPFGIGQEPTYPIRVGVAPRAEKQSRLKVFFRLILMLPLALLAYFGMGSLLFGASVVAWITIVFRGYQPRGIHDAMAFALTWHARFLAYGLLLRDEYPPVGDEGYPRGQSTVPAQPPSPAAPAERPPSA